MYSPHYTLLEDTRNLLVRGSVINGVEVMHFEWGMREATFNEILLCSRHDNHQCHHCPHNYLMVYSFLSYIGSCGDIYKKWRGIKSAK